MSDIILVSGNAEEVRKKLVSNGVSPSTVNVQEVYEQGNRDRVLPDICAVVFDPSLNPHAILQESGIHIAESASLAPESLTNIDDFGEELTIDESIASVTELFSVQESSHSLVTLDRVFGHSEEKKPDSTIYFAEGTVLGQVSEQIGCGFLATIRVNDPQEGVSGAYNTSQDFAYESHVWRADIQNDTVGFTPDGQFLIVQDRSFAALLENGVNGIITAVATVGEELKAGCWHSYSDGLDGTHTSVAREMVDEFSRSSGADYSGEEIKYVWTRNIESDIFKSPYCPYDDEVVNHIAEMIQDYFESGDAGDDLED